MPKFALVEVLVGKFRVEPFNPARHICPYGWTWPGVHLFDDPKSVAHLRDLIVN